ncbi:MAG: Uncharacterized protein XD58_1155 [Thermotoga sp. 50_1627]|uniref:hypothetical protein n=1 Tax=Pseudothermotoga sp. TaxID=2033661 RepID=UPI00076BCC25|nr:MAG: Uncharacterized protein XD45_1257 [Thermotoga sp. 50_64]KUK24849.1 MAG: Uncharacterized protein XD58_1155 [Thermotoga sp. 50_1627]MBC7116921.1 hypothetical protein [Pseudothermotoga sp.]MDK2923776.1 hypothetical protein [Pseudothermotoga sp.]HBT39754.1 hypothetical protein [Pseudothermotoga sp.]
MRNLTLFLLLASCLVLAAVSYQFKNSQLLIVGLETYDEVELELDGKKVTLPVSQLNIPWRKNYNTTLVLTPIKNGVRASPVRLYIDASKDRAPTVKLKVPSYYVPLGKLTLEIFAEDDWDEAGSLRYSVYLDGVRIDPPKGGRLLLDTFFMHSGERRLRIVCRDSGSNIVDQTYKFVVVPVPPRPPQFSQGRIVSNRTHRVYIVQDGRIEAYETRSDELKEQLAFVCDLDAASNESFPVLYYKKFEFVQQQNPVLMNLNDSCSLSSEHTIFGRVVIPSEQKVVLKTGSTLRINSGCELIVRGTLLLERGAKVTGSGNLLVVESGKLVAMGAAIETNVSVDGATTLWFSDTDLSRSKLQINRSFLTALKNVKASQLIIDNVRKLWIDSSDFGILELLNCGNTIIMDSKMSQLKVSRSSRVRMYSCSIYSTRTAVSVSDLSSLETIDSWISGKIGVNVENFSLFRARSTQINADTAVVASGYSVIDSFASVLAGTKALQLRDAKFTFLKTQVLGGTEKFGLVEVSER